VSGDEASAVGGARRHRRDMRRLVATVLAVALCLTLFGGLFAAWADMTLFDQDTFASRTTKLLDSPAVRHEVAVQLTDAVIQNGPSQLAGFRAIILPVVEDVIQTPAFKATFRNAMKEAHRSLFTQDGNDLVVNLSQSLGVLAGSLQISNPDVAANIPTGLDQFLVDLGDNIRGMELWKTARDFDQLASGLLTTSVALAVAVIVIDRHMRRGVFKVGVAMAAAGFLIVGVAVVAPRIAAMAVSNDAVKAALRQGIGIFVSDLQVIGVWTIGYGVIAAGLATASAPRHAAIDPRAFWVVARDRWLGWSPTTTGRRIWRSAVIIGAGILLILERDSVLPLTVALFGAYVAYYGVVQLLTVVGRTTSDRAMARATRSPEEREREHRGAWAIAGGVGLVLLLTIGGTIATRAARTSVAEASERQCNGSAELCDRTIDRVAFAGSHNSMSSSSDPGWLFAEQSAGIPAQLNDGVRALLVKTHYGIPSGITFTGADLVVTDRAAELAVNPKAVEDALPGGGSAAQAQQLAASAKIDPSKRDVYLCHVYCEYGATRFRTVLDDIKRFLDKNPDEVIILFVGNYVSADDTQRVFQDAGLFDRLYPYDQTQPPPTLGQMIDARQNIFLLSEFSGQPPAWNNPGYGLFQDTPFTFTDPQQLVVDGAAGSEPSGTTYDTGYVPDTIVEPDTALPTDTTLAFGKDWTGQPSCAPNRGTPDSPLFQINHFVTPSGSAPTVAQAKQVNAYDVLMPRVRACMTERGRFPTIVGVDFATSGDLLKVVDDLNGTD
jgi:hypothetical protein